MKIGIDFDNTLVSYDRAFAIVGKEQGFLPADFADGKERVKDRVLQGASDGLFRWERLQGLVYGQCIDRAELFDGVAEFFFRLRARKDVTVFVVSHKTMIAHHDPKQTNLRAAALRFMQANCFFEESGFGLKAEQVFFESSREEKVSRISALACDIFIDDLPEVLEHPDMPVACRKILFRSKFNGPFERAANWYDIADAICGPCRASA
jgi:hypothetical protein